jgi:hypothetical protein
MLQAKHTAAASKATAYSSLTPPQMLLDNF